MTFNPIPAARMRLSTAFVCSGLFFNSLVVADVDTSKLQVHIPQSLVKKGGYDHRDALFGIPPYGGSIQEKVYYAQDTFCGPQVDTTIGYPEEKDDSGKRIPWKSPYILMVDRGDCTFVQKVRNAQRAGAAAVLIADNVCMCDSVDCEMGPDQDVCETQEPIMADDGSGADISIPSFLVFKQDADKIKDVLMQNQHVRVEMSFSVPAPDARVEYDLWTTPADEISRSFLKSFSIAVAALDKDAFFTPHMYIYDGIMAGCHTDDGYDYCTGLCTNVGRYCSNDPDGDLEYGVSGADVVAESLRRICIWKQYGETDGMGKEWWKYVEEFLLRCDDPEKPDFFTSEDCLNDVMTRAGVDKAAIDKCMADSGGLEDDTENKLLSASIDDKETSGAFLVPSIFVNNAPVRGELVFGTVFKAICSGYASGYEPKVCVACANCHDEAACVRDGACKSGYDSTGSNSNNGGVSHVTFASSLAGVVVLFTVIGFIVHRRQQQRMRDEVRGIMAEYMPVNANSRKGAVVDTAVSDEVDDSEDGSGGRFTIS